MTNIPKILILLLGITDQIVFFKKNFLFLKKYLFLSIYLFGSTGSQLWCVGSSSLTRTRTWPHALGAQRLSHWTTSEVHGLLICRFRQLVQMHVTLGFIITFTYSLQFIYLFLNLSLEEVRKGNNVTTVEGKVSIVVPDRTLEKCDQSLINNFGVQYGYLQ